MFTRPKPSSSKPKNAPKRNLQLIKYLIIRTFYVDRLIYGMDDDDEIDGSYIRNNENIIYAANDSFDDIPRTDRYIRPGISSTDLKFINDNIPHFDREHNGIVIFKSNNIKRSLAFLENGEYCRMSTHTVRAFTGNSLFINVDTESG